MNARTHRRRDACTPTTRAREPRPVRTMQQPDAPLPPPTGVKIQSTSRQVVEDLGCECADARDQPGLVRRMHVAPPFSRRDCLDMFASLVEVAAILHHVGAKRAHGRHLVGIASDRHEDVARHTVDAARKGDRLSMIAGAGANDAASSFVGSELGDQIQPAADFECTGRIVVFVFHPRLAPNPLIEKGVAQQRRRLQVCVYARASGFDVVQRGWVHGRRNESRTRAATSGLLLIRPSTLHPSNLRMSGSSSTVHTCTLKPPSCA